MSEEVKVIVTQEAHGPDAIAKANRDLEKLDQTRKSSLATPPPDLNAPQSPSAAAAAKAAAAERRQAVQNHRSLAADAEEDLARAKARKAGAAEIQELTSQMREQKLAARFVGQQGLGSDEAIAKARNLVSLQNEARAHKENEAAAARKQGEEEKKAAAAKKEANAKEKEDAKKVSDERRQQESLDKARESHLLRVARAGGRAADNLAGGSPFSGLASAVGSVGGVPGKVLAATIAATVGIAAAFARQRDVAQMAAMERGTEHAVALRQITRQGGADGTAESNRAMALEKEDDAFHRNLDRERLQKKSEFKWYNPAGWIDKLTGASENEKEDNEGKIKNDLTEAEKARQQMRAKYAAEVAPLVEAQKKINEGHASEGRQLQDNVTRLQEKNRLIRAGATEAEAEAGADVKMGTIAREREGNYAKLVNARDGAGDIARIASLAKAERVRTTGRGDGDIAHLTEVVRQQHRQAMDAAWRAKFTKQKP